MSLFLGPFVLLQLVLFAVAGVVEQDEIAWSNGDLALDLLAVPIFASIVTLMIMHHLSPRRAFLMGSPRYWRLIPMGLFAAIASSTLSAASIGALGDMWDTRIPEWSVIALWAILLTALCTLFLPRHSPGHCRCCGYDRRGIVGRCPECGEGDWELFESKASAAQSSAAQSSGQRP